MTSSRTPVPQETIANTPTIEPTIPASINELPGAELPPGFSLIKFAMVPRPTAFAFDAAGRMYVTSQDEHIYLVTDANHDGRITPEERMQIHQRMKEMKRPA